MNFLLTLLKPLALKLLAGFAIVTAILFVLLRVRREGRMLERAEAYQRTARAAVQRRKIDVQVQGYDDDALDDLLRPPARRAEDQS